MKKTDIKELIRIAEADLKTINIDCDNCKKYIHKKTDSCIQLDFTKKNLNKFIADKKKLLK